MPALKVSQDHKRLTVPWLKGLLVPGEETVTSLKELMAELIDNKSSCNRLLS